jgi:hypothetical protein
VSSIFWDISLGPRLHPDLDALFIDNSDKLVAEIPSGGLLKQYWDEINEKLLSQFQNLSADEWLLQHHAIRGRLCQRSDPEPIGCLVESNKSPFLPSGTGDVGSQIAGPTRGHTSGFPKSAHDLAAATTIFPALHLSARSAPTLIIGFSIVWYSTIGIAISIPVSTRIRLHSGYEAIGSATNHMQN